jgi:hypothetical protein
MCSELYDLLSGKGVYPDHDEESGLQSDEQDAGSESSGRKKKPKTRSAKSKKSTKLSKPFVSDDDMLDTANTSTNDLGLSSGQDFGLTSDKSMVSLLGDGKIIDLSSTLGSIPFER